MTSPANRSTSPEAASLAVANGRRTLTRVLLPSAVKGAIGFTSPERRLSRHRFNVRVLEAGRPIHSYATVMTAAITNHETRNEGT